ncbi:dethiobiotin synthase [Phenylobacterium sp.]|uniref:dethiobiotin synthase n=1 Tax=Phenylobacterium sp. TaxID=1871053 RepID=UPI002F42D4F1
MPALFVTGTGTDVGKTYVCAALLRALAARGHAVDALKPVVSGFDPAALEDSDPAVLLRALGRPVTPQALAALSPWRFAAPLSPPLAARREGRALSATEVIGLCRERAGAAHDRLLLVEGAGGVMSPLDETATMLDLAAALQAPALLVAGSYLGTISHTLTAAAALRGAGVDLAAVAVSESLDAPPLGETVEALARFLDVPVFAIPRGGEAPAELVGRLTPAACARPGSSSDR